MINLRKNVFCHKLILFSLILTSCSQKSSTVQNSQKHLGSGCRHDFSQSSTLHKLVIQNKTLPCSVCKREIPPATEWVSRCAAGTNSFVGFSRINGCGYQRCLPCDLDEFRKSRGNYYHDKHIKPIDDAYASGNLTDSQYKLMHRQALNQVKIESEQDYGKSGAGFNFSRPEGSHAEMKDIVETNLNDFTPKSLQRSYQQSPSKNSMNRSLNLTDAKNELLDKYLSKEITKEEYFQLRRELEKR